MTAYVSKYLQLPSRMFKFNISMLQRTHPGFLIISELRPLRSMKVTHECVRWFRN